MKIAIVGYSGSGKSTLAEWLGDRNEVPVLYMDTVYWLPGWKVRDKEERRQMLLEFLDTNDSWVIDGTYKGHFFDRRMEEADQIIFMNFNRLSCFLRAWKRQIVWKGKCRKSITPGCEEKFDWEFIRWILWDSRKRDEVTPFRRILRDYPDKMVIIRNQRELDRFMTAYPARRRDTH